jgi:hypothetical protein
LQAIGPQQKVLAGAAAVPIHDEAVAEDGTIEESAGDEEYEESAPWARLRSFATNRTLLVALAVGVAAGLLTWWLKHA